MIALFNLAAYARPVIVALVIGRQSIVSAPKSRRSIARSSRELAARRVLYSVVYTSTL